MPPIHPDTPLPDFGRPPLVEVALSVQLEPVTNLHTPQIGLLWQEYRDRFPQTEEHPPLERVIENFDAGSRPKARPGLKFLTAPPPPRCWFLNSQGSGLIQVQSDRFVHNWRRVNDDDDTYPRYETVRGTFERELERFKSLIEEHAAGHFVPNQCEVTYVNHIVPGTVWQTHADLGKVITLFKPRFTDAFAPELEDCRLTARCRIPAENGEPIGRLHVAVEPGYRDEDGAPIFAVTLTARGRPLTESVNGVMGFLDLGREWIVRTFASITTADMHASWERIH